MNQEEINKYLTEQMGECWHIEGRYYHVGSLLDSGECEKCKAKASFANKYLRNNNFFTPDGFIKLWTWAMEQEWWKDFWWAETHQIRELDSCSLAMATAKITGMINPKRFATAIYNFLKERENNGL